MLISTQSKNMAIMDRNSGGGLDFDCTVENFCLDFSYSSSVQTQIEYCQNEDASFSFQKLSDGSITTTLGGKKAAEGSNIFSINSGMVEIIHSNQNGIETNNNWPFTAGILGLSPDSLFFQYLISSIEFQHNNSEHYFLIDLEYTKGPNGYTNNCYCTTDFEGKLTLGHTTMDLNQPEFWTEAKQSSYSFPNSLFGVKDGDNSIIGTVPDGKLCIVSDMKNLFIMHKDANLINKGIAHLACRNDDIEDCRFETAEDLFKNLPFFYIRVYDNENTKDKETKTKTYEIDPRDFLNVDDQGWLRSTIATSGYNTQQNDLSGLYGCPDGTAMIVGNKFLTSYSLAIKIGMSDANDPTTAIIYFGVKNLRQDQIPI